MALEAVVFQQDLLGCLGKEMNNLSGRNWSCELGFDKSPSQHHHRTGFWFENSEPSPTPADHYFNYGSWGSPVPCPDPSTAEQLTSSPEPHRPWMNFRFPPEDDPPPLAAAFLRPKRRRRVKSRRNQDDLENQRMTHIAVERNRRKQMNEYLAVLRSLMPDSYAQRGDQASIVGGAIDFVKELEQRLQFLGTRKESPKPGDGDAAARLPFSEFFAFPQYSTAAAAQAGADGFRQATAAPGIADVEVTMVESHANVHVRTRRLPKQLLRVVSGLQAVRLTVLHLNVTAVGQIVLYGLSVRVEEECRLGSADEIATAVHGLIAGIQEEVFANI